MTILFKKSSETIREETNIFSYSNAIYLTNSESWFNGFLHAQNFGFLDFELNSNRTTLVLKTSDKLLLHNLTNATQACDVFYVPELQVYWVLVPLSKIVNLPSFAIIFNINFLGFLKIFNYFLNFSFFYVFKKLLKTKTCFINYSWISGFVFDGFFSLNYKKNTLFSFFKVCYLFFYSIAFLSTLAFWFKFTLFIFENQLIIVFSNYYNNLSEVFKIKFFGFLHILKIKFQLYYNKYIFNF